jgi:hypothetical protein
MNRNAEDTFTILNEILGEIRSIRAETRRANKLRLQRSFDIKDAAACLGVSDATFAKIRQAMALDGNDPVIKYPGVPMGRVPVETLDAIRLGTTTS